MSVDVYGRLLAAPTLERGAEVCLRYHLGHYLGEVLEQAGHARDALPDPSDLVRVSDPRWPVATTTALVVVAVPGTVGEAVRDGEAYTARWEVQAGVLVDFGAGDDGPDSREAAQFYAAAAGAALTHQGIARVEPDRRTWTQGVDGDFLTLEGSSVVWRGERYRQLAEREDRALIEGAARVLVTVQGARSAWGGPDVPPGDPNVGPVPREPPEELGEPAPVTPAVTIDRT